MENENSRNENEGIIVKRLLKRINAIYSFSLNQIELLRARNVPKQVTTRFDEAFHSYFQATYGSYAAIATKVFLNSLYFIYTEAKNLPKKVIVSFAIFHSFYHRKVELALVSEYIALRNATKNRRIMKKNRIVCILKEIHLHRKEICAFLTCLNSRSTSRDFLLTSFVQWRTKVSVLEDYYGAISFHENKVNSLDLVNFDEVVRVPSTYNLENFQHQPVSLYEERKLLDINFFMARHNVLINTSAALIQNFFKRVSQRRLLLSVAVDILSTRSTETQKLLKMIEIFEKYMRKCYIYEMKRRCKINGNSSRSVENIGIGREQELRYSLKQLILLRYTKNVLCQFNRIFVMCHCFLLLRRKCICFQTKFYLLDFRAQVLKQKTKRALYCCNRYFYYSLKLLAIKIWRKVAYFLERMPVYLRFVILYNRSYNCMQQKSLRHYFRIYHQQTLKLSNGIHLALSSILKFGTKMKQSYLFKWRGRSLSLRLVEIKKVYTVQVVKNFSLILTGRAIINVSFKVLNALERRRLTVHRFIIIIEHLVLHSAFDKHISHVNDWNKTYLIDAINRIINDSILKVVFSLALLRRSSSLTICKLLGQNLCYLKFKRYLRANRYLPKFQANIRRIASNKELERALIALLFGERNTKHILFWSMSQITSRQTFERALYFLFYVKQRNGTELIDNEFYKRIVANDESLNLCHLACSHGYFEYFLWFIDMGCDVLKITSKGSSILSELMRISPKKNTLDVDLIINQFLSHIGYSYPQVFSCEYLNYSFWTLCLEKKRFSIVFNWMLQAYQLPEDISVLQLENMEFAEYQVKVITLVHFDVLFNFVHNFSEFDLRESLNTILSATCSLVLFYCCADRVCLLQMLLQKLPSDAILFIIEEILKEDTRKAIVACQKYLACKSLENFLLVLPLTTVSTTREFCNQLLEGIFFAKLVLRNQCLSSNEKVYVLEQVGSHGYMVRTDKEVLSLAILMNDIELCTYFISLGMDINYIYDLKQGITPYFSATEAFVSHEIFQDFTVRGGKYLFQDLKGHTVAHHLMMNVQKLYFNRNQLGDKVVALYNLSKKWDFILSFDYEQTFPAQVTLLLHIKNQMNLSVLGCCRHIMDPFQDHFNEDICTLFLEILSPTIVEKEFSQFKSFLKDVWSIDEVYRIDTNIVCKKSKTGDRSSNHIVSYLLQIAMKYYRHKCTIEETPIANDTFQTKPTLEIDFNLVHSLLAVFTRIVAFVNGHYVYELQLPYKENQLQNEQNEVKLGRFSNVIDFIETNCLNNERFILKQERTRYFLQKIVSPGLPKTIIGNDKVICEMFNEHGNAWYILNGLSCKGKSFRFPVKYVKRQIKRKVMCRLDLNAKRLEVLEENRKLISYEARQQAILRIQRNFKRQRLSRLLKANITQKRKQKAILRLQRAYRRRKLERCIDIKIKKWFAAIKLQTFIRLQLKKCCDFYETIAQLSKQKAVKTIIAWLRDEFIKKSARLNILFSAHGKEIIRRVFIYESKCSCLVKQTREYEYIKEFRFIKVFRGIRVYLNTLLGELFLDKPDFLHERDNIQFDDMITRYKFGCSRREMEAAIRIQRFFVHKKRYYWLILYFQAFAIMTTSEEKYLNCSQYKPLRYTQERSGLNIYCQFPNIGFNAGSISHSGRDVFFINYFLYQLIVVQDKRNVERNFPQLKLIARKHKFNAFCTLTVAIYTASFVERKVDYIKLVNLLKSSKVSRFVGYELVRLELGFILAPFNTVSLLKNKSTEALAFSYFVYAFFLQHYGSCLKYSRGINYFHSNNNATMFKRPLDGKLYYKVVDNEVSQKDLQLANEYYLKAILNDQENISFQVHYKYFLRYYLKVADTVEQRFFEYRGRVSLAK